MDNHLHIVPNCFWIIIGNTMSVIVVGIVIMMLVGLAAALHHPRPDVQDVVGDGSEPEKKFLL